MHHSSKQVRQPEGDLSAVLSSDALAADLPDMNTIMNKIIRWYRENRRSLPWRDNPTPYTTWIAEIMLQQTRIEAVIPYYHRFLHELPDIPSLAKVPEDRLLKLWEGLGYYSRARNLKKAAGLVVQQHGGMLPASVAELKKLPGIGDYTAGSIASIAFGLPEPAVDGNVLRVISRLLASSEDIMLPATRKRVTELLREHYPAGEDAGLLTEGLMELGETVCLPNAAPRCESCPVASLCLAHRVGNELNYPVKAEAKERRIENRTILLLRQGDRFAIRKRPAKGLLAGLWEFPGLDGHLDEETVARMFPQAAVRPAGKSKHIFTHVEWHMLGYLVSLSEGEAIPAGCGLMQIVSLSEGESPESSLSSDDIVWKTPEEINASYSLPTAFRYYRNRLSTL